MKAHPIMLSLELLFKYVIIVVIVNIFRVGNEQDENQPTPHNRDNYAGT